MQSKNINPAFAIVIVLLVGGLLGSFLWTRAANLGTQFEFEDRIIETEED